MVQQVTDHNEILLEDQKVVKLVDIEIPLPRDGQEGDYNRQVHDYLVKRIEGGKIWLLQVRPEPDRWNRTPAVVFLQDDEGSFSILQEELLQAGLSRRSFEGTGNPCQTLFKGAEASAREEKLGLWGDPFESLIEANKPPDVLNLTARDGRMSVIEGKILSSRESQTRVYWLFGSRPFYNFSLSISKSQVKLFEKGGMSKFLVGHKVRVRGHLSLEFGPQIDLNDPGQIEILD